MASSLLLQTDMVDIQSIKKMILGSRRFAEEDMAAIKAQMPLTKEFFSCKIRDYVLHKYLLFTEMELPEDFTALTELSLSRSMKISQELVKQFDLAASCDGATSAMAKKVLLFMAIQKELSIQLPAMASARITTLQSLADLAWNEMLSSPEWKNRLEC